MSYRGIRFILIPRFFIALWSVKRRGSIYRTPIGKSGLNKLSPYNYTPIYRIVGIDLTFFNQVDKINFGE